MNRHTGHHTGHRTTTHHRHDETNEVLFTWDGGDSRHSIEDGLDAFLRHGRPRRVRLRRAVLATLLSARRG